MSDLSNYHPNDEVDPERAAVLITYANQIDPRIQVNAPTRDVWADALRGVRLGIARDAIVRYYAKAKSETAGFDVPVLRPSAIRAQWNEYRMQEEQEQLLIEQREHKRNAVPMPDWFKKRIQESKLKQSDDAA